MLTPKLISLSAVLIASFKKFLHYYSDLKTSLPKKSSQISMTHTTHIRRVIHLSIIKRNQSTLAVHMISWPKSGSLCLAPGPDRVLPSWPGLLFFDRTWLSGKYFYCVENKMEIKNAIDDDDYWQRVRSVLQTNEFISKVMSAIMFCFLVFFDAILFFACQASNRLIKNNGKINKFEIIISFFHFFSTFYSSPTNFLSNSSDRPFLLPQPFSLSF